MNRDNFSFNNMDSESESEMVMGRETKQQFDAQSVSSSRSGKSSKSSQSGDLRSLGDLGGMQGRDMGYEEDNDADTQSVSSYAGSELDETQIKRKKTWALRKMFRMSKKLGIPLSKGYTMDHDLDDMMDEIQSLKRESQLSTNVKMAECVLTYGVKGLEMLNTTFDPVGAQLDGWGEFVQKDVDAGKFEDVLEDLSDKYGMHFDTGPELTLVKMLGMSALQFHTSKMFAGNQFADYQRLKQQEEASKRASMGGAPQKAQSPQKPQRQAPPAYTPNIPSRPEAAREMTAPSELDDLLAGLEDEVDIELAEENGIGAVDIGATGGMVFDDI